MKKAFTLIELLVVTVVIAILASIVFKLAGATEDKSAIQTTIIRMQKLENCLSGYYAAFGCYPPVPLQGRSRNPFFRIVTAGRQGPLIQEIDEDPNYGTYDYNMVKAACQAQPVKAEFNYSTHDREIPENLSKFIQARMSRDPDYAKAFSSWTAGMPFGANDGTGNESSSSSRGGSAREQFRWRDLQKFKFGLMSFLVPRYLLMMGCESDDAFNYYQWDGNNSRPCRFDTGVPYETWAELNALLKDENVERNRWQVELIPSQAITQRWLPNLEGICDSGSAPLSFYGITLTPDGVAGAMGMDPQHPEFISELVYPSGSSGQGRMNNFLTVKDGWEQEFFYYSPPPYQNYRLWSAGKNMVTFPPWFTPEEMKEHNDKMMTYTVLYKSGIISVKEAIADDVVHLSH